MFSREITEEKAQKMLTQAEKSELPQIVSTLDLLLAIQNKNSSFLLPQLALEIVIIKATQKFPAPKPSSEPEIRMENVAVQSTTFSTTPITQKIENSLQENKTEIVAPTENNRRAEIDPNAQINLDQLRRHWNRLLVDIRQCNHSLCALLGTCQLKSAEGNIITLVTPYDFYKDKLEDPQNRLTIETVFSKILGLAVRVQIVVDKTIAPVPKDELSSQDNAEENQKAPGEQSSLLSSAMEIMGGTIVE